MIPARVAIALQADGWWLRSDIIWAKPNPMPESVTDRPTSAHEHVFLLTKCATYFYDAEAVKEPHEMPRKSGRLTKNVAGCIMVGRGSDRERSFPNPLGRNLRNVWTIATRPYKGAHFATMPPGLVERCIRAGCPKDGTVLDPFAGAGTTLLVADRLGRHIVGIELNAEYAALARARISSDAGMFAQVAAE